MIDKEIFKKKVFEKYNDNLDEKDEFYVTPIYSSKDKKSRSIIKTILTHLIPVVAAMGVVYAGVNMNTSNYVSQKSKTDFVNNVEYDYSQYMDYQDKIYYDFIKNYGDYENSLKQWPNLLKMNEEEFNEYFVLVIAVENTSLMGLSFSNLTCDDNTMYVELYQSANASIEDGSVISVKVPLQQLRENIKFNVTGRQPQDSNYVSIRKISKDYSEEQAVKDGCFVIKNKDVISEDANELVDFINSKSNGFIRIVDFEYATKINDMEFESATTVTDIEFEDGNYYINILDLETGKITYMIMDELMVVRYKGMDEYSILAQGKYIDQCYLVTININEEN